ncbi:MAG: aspartate aminotransferase family protein [Alphaproteobacteria bacterium]|nr:aspartate aminotransferase family protein [Alphaproteobacteria bacterium]
MTSGSAPTAAIAPVLPTYNRAAVSFERGHGARAYTPEGEEYLDFGSGVAVNSCGHAHPHLVKALTEQAEKIWHTSNVYQMPGQTRLAERLIAHSFADTVFFCNSGTEASELAIKMARKFHAASGHPEKFHIITFTGAFHGRSLGALAATGNDKYLDGFGPPLSGFDQVEFGDLKAAEAAIGPHTAAIYVEPVQGEGGVMPATHEFLRGLRKLCDAHGLLLMLDEIQCGMGRTGKLFAYEWAGIAPDIMALAKGLGGGFPIGAVLATANAAKGMVAGTHGSTFGGNPLATAVGNAVLDVVLADGFLDNVQRQSLNLKQSLERLKDLHPTLISDVRGSGLMMGLKCKVQNTDVQKAIVEQKLLVLTAGDNVVRLLPPLIVTHEDVTEAIAKIERALVALEHAKA